jgi:hypothetical protein
MTNPTEIRIHWHTHPQLTVSVVLQRAVSSGELHHLAEVVERAEEFRADVQGVEDVLESS